MVAKLLEYVLYNKSINCVALSLVSDHHKASPDPIIFLKLRWALMDHNILMKRIGSRVFILNHSGNFFGGHFHIFVAFWSFFSV